MKPHLLAFVRWRENIAKANPWQLQHSGPYGRFFHCLLSGKQRHPNRHADYQIDHSIYRATLQVCLPADAVSTMRIVITDRDAVSFNQFVHDMLHDHLIDRIASAAPKTQIKEIIEDLIDDMDAWGDADFETIKKANYRIRKARGLPMRRGRSSFHQHDAAHTFAI